MRCELHVRKNAFCMGGRLAVKKLLCLLPRHAFLLFEHLWIKIYAIIIIILKTTNADKRLDSRLCGYKVFQQALASFSLHFVSCQTKVKPYY